MTTQETAQGAGVRELGHLVLYVADIGTSTAFYEDALGWRRLTSPPELGTLPIALFSSAAPITSCCSSKSVGQRLPCPRAGTSASTTSACGSAIPTTTCARSETASTPWGADRGVSDHGVTHSLYVLDPDGNEVELYVDVADVDWGDFAAIAGPPRPLTL